MDIEKFVKENKGLVLCFIAIGILIILMMNVETISHAMVGDIDMNPFPKMRACEEQHSISGYLHSVDYIEGGYQNRYTLIVIDSRQMNFKDWDFKRLTPFENQYVEMIYYSNCETSEYYLGCLDHDRFCYDIVLKPLG